jgi:predicted RNA-binding protein associated with RNAse of E/G family
MNARFEFASPVGSVTHPCQQGTRYRRFLFSSKDYEKVVTLKKAGNVTNVYLDGLLRSTIVGTVASVSGHVPFPDGR